MTTASTPCIRTTVSTQHIVDNVDNKGLTPARTGSIRRVGASPQVRFWAISGEKLQLASQSPARHSPARARLALFFPRNGAPIHAAGPNQGIFAALFHLVERRELQHALLHPALWRAGGP